MARLPRYTLPEQAQHLIQRGNNRQAIFFSEGDYEFFLECVTEGATRYGCRIHAYVLMTNHVHLLLTPERPDSLSKLMQSVGRRYVHYVNYVYRRTGTLWEGRFKATPVDSDGYLLTCYRYIEMNPVRAGMVSQPGDYRWSSYRANAHGGADEWLVAHPAYLDLGREDSSRRAVYRQLFAESLDDETLARLRETVNKGWALGSERFQVEIEAMTQRQSRPKPRGGVRKAGGSAPEKDDQTSDLFNRV